MCVIFRLAWLCCCSREQSWGWWWRGSVVTSNRKAAPSFAIPSLRVRASTLNRPRLQSHLLELRGSYGHGKALARVRKDTSQNTLSSTVAADHKVAIVVKPPSHVWLCDLMDSNAPGFPVLYYLPRVCSNSCPLNRWCHPAVSFLCHSLLLLPSVFLSIRVFSNELGLHIRWPKYWSFCFGISPSSEYSGLISFRTDWFDLLAVKGTLESLLQHHSSKASVFWCSAFFMIQLSHVYMTTGKTIALTRWTFVNLKEGQDKCWQISFVGRCWVLDYYFWTLVGSIRLIADESAHLHLTENLVSFLHLTCFLTLVREMVKSGHARSSAIKDGKKILCWYSSGQGYSVSGN